jgi:hypothetical protein
MTLRGHDDFWTYFVMCIPFLIWLTMAPYAFLSLPVSVLVSVLTLVAVSGVLRWRRCTVRRREAADRRRQIEAQFEHARWAVMTNLTEADERWLADRHFWVLPVEVARLRAGMNPHSDWDFQCREEMRQVEEMRARSEAARAAFEGIKRTSPHIEWREAS